MVHSLFPRAALSPVGLDIGSHTVHAVQLERARGGRAAVHAVASFPRLNPGTDPGPDEFARALAILDRQGFRTDDAVLAAPPAGTCSSTVELPPRNSGAPLDQIAAVELSRAIKQDPGTFEMSWWEIPSPPRASEGIHALAVALPHRVAHDLVELVETHGCQVRAIDTRPLALARAAAPLAGANITAIAELGWDSGLLVLVKQGVVIYERALQGWSLRGLHDSIAAATDSDAELSAVILGSIDTSAPAGPGEGAAVVRRCLRTALDTLERELAVSISYAEHRFSAAGQGDLDRLLLCGPGASLPGVNQRLGPALRVAVHTLTPGVLAEVPQPLLRRCASPDLVTALGLALWNGDPDR